jgi:hypothetical protein
MPLDVKIGRIWPSDKHFLSQATPAVALDAGNGKTGSRSSHTPVRRRFSSAWQADQSCRFRSVWVRIAVKHMAEELEVGECHAVEASMLVTHFRKSKAILLRDTAPPRWSQRRSVTTQPFEAVEHGSPVISTVSAIWLGFAPM